LEVVEDETAGVVNEGLIGSGFILVVVVAVAEVAGVVGVEVWKVKVSPGMSQPVRMKDMIIKIIPVVIKFFIFNIA
jgi:hypothetical protein